MPQPNNPKQLTAPDSTQPKSPTRRPDRATVDRLNELITRTNSGTPTHQDVHDLRTLLAEYPIIYHEFGDLAPYIHTRISNLIHDQTLVRESIRLAADDLRAQLTEPTDTPLQKLLIEQCITAYLLHTATEIHYMSKGLYSSKNVWDDRLDNSQKRFLRALETLARLRQTPTSPMQINIAETQTNIVTPNPSPTPPTPDETTP